VGPNDVRVKVNAIAINPIDWYRTDYGILNPGYPFHSGCDFSGVIDAIGESVTDNDIAVGDAVFGANTNFTVLDAGSYSEYTIVPGNNCALIKKPENWSWGQAASLPVSAFTSYFGLFYHTELNLSPDGPSSDDYSDKTVLVWGGATSVGIYAIQWLATAGYHVITTASEKNFDLVRSLGAAEVFDYKAEDVVQQLNSSTKNRLRYAFDTAGASATVYQVVKTDGDAVIADIASLDRHAPVPPHIKYSVTLMANQHTLTDGKEFFKDAGRRLIENLNNHKFQWTEQLEFNGIESIIDAVATQKGGVSAKKVVVTF